MLKEHECAQHRPILVRELMTGRMDTCKGGCVGPFNGLNCIFKALILPVKVVPRALILNWCSRNSSLPIQVQKIDGEVLAVPSESF